MTYVPTLSPMDGLPAHPYDIETVNISYGWLFNSSVRHTGLCHIIYGRLMISSVWNNYLYHPIRTTYFFIFMPYGPMIAHTDDFLTHPYGIVTFRRFELEIKPTPMDGTLAAELLCRNNRVHVCHPGGHHWHNYPSNMHIFKSSRCNPFPVRVWSKISRNFLDYQESSGNFRLRYWHHLRQG